MTSPTDVKPLAPPASCDQLVNKGAPLALRRAVEVGRRIPQICLCSGMGEIEEPPPEMHVLETRNNSNKPGLAVSLEVILCFPT